MEEKLFRAITNKLCRDVAGFGLRPHFSWRDPSTFILGRRMCGRNSTLVEDKGKSYLNAKLYYQDDGGNDQYLTMIMLRDNAISFFNVEPLGQGKYSEELAENVPLGDPELWETIEKELRHRWSEK